MGPIVAVATELGVTVGGRLTYVPPEHREIVALAVTPNNTLVVALAPDRPGGSAELAVSRDRIPLPPDFRPLSGCLTTSGRASALWNRTALCLVAAGKRGPQLVVGSAERGSARMPVLSGAVTCVCWPHPLVAAVVTSKAICTYTCTGREWRLAHTVKTSDLPGTPATLLDARADGTSLVFLEATKESRLKVDRVYVKPSGQVVVMRGQPPPRTVPLPSDPASMQLMATDNEAHGLFYAPDHNTWITRRGGDGGWAGSVPVAPFTTCVAAVLPDEQESGLVEHVVLLVANPPQLSPTRVRARGSRVLAVACSPAKHTHPLPPVEKTPAASGGKPGGVVDPKTATGQGWKKDKGRGVVVVPIPLLKSIPNNGKGTSGRKSAPNKTAAARPTVPQVTARPAVRPAVRVTTRPTARPTARGITRIP